MYYTVYKITNLVNDKIYIGVHKTSNLDDGYMGSGKLIKLAINKYGVENFKKEYLHIFDNQEDMYDMESILVNEEYLERDDVYNLKVGGEGGWDCVNANLTREHYIASAKKANAIFIEKLNNDEEFRKSWHENMTRSVKESLDRLRSNPELWEEHLQRTQRRAADWWIGKTHKKETIEKMKAAHAKNNHQQGSKNSMYGKMWITNPELKENTTINKNDIIPEGWVKGRKMYK